MKRKDLLNGTASVTIAEATDFHNWQRKITLVDDDDGTRETLVLNPYAFVGLDMLLAKKRGRSNGA